MIKEFSVLNVLTHPCEIYCIYGLNRLDLHHNIRLRRVGFYGCILLSVCLSVML